MAARRKYPDLRTYEREKKRRYRARRAALVLEQTQRAARTVTLDERAARGELVAMRLQHPLELDDRSYAAGEMLWVLPGTAHMLERAHFAVQEERGTMSFGVRVITNPPGRGA